MTCGSAGAGLGLPEPPGPKMESSPMAILSAQIHLFRR